MELHRNKEPLKPDVLEAASLLVIAGPREKFSSEEVGNFFFSEEGSEAKH